MPTDERFLGALRHALKHLYDLTALRESPLVGLLGLSPAPDPAASLRHTLIEAIHSLQPPDEMPAHTEVWRVYEVLLYRYVQRCNQVEVADQLGLSVRHLGRVERTALEALATRLHRRLVLSDRETAEPVARGTSEPLEPAAPADGLEWLQQPYDGEPVDLAQALLAVVELVQPLAGQYRASLDVPSLPELPSVAIHPVALRQALLSLLSAAIRRCQGGRVALRARPLGAEIEVQVRASPAGAGEDTRIAEGLAVARRVLQATGGRLTLDLEGASFSASALLPALEQVPVLLIDDHRGTRDLFQRCVAGTPYRVYPAATLQEALTLARQVPPRLIVLDVMMPDMDGWEVLGRLRQHPLTSGAPILVCSIVAEEELAYSLGASGYLRKPAGRQDFLAALAGLMGTHGNSWEVVGTDGTGG